MLKILIQKGMRLTFSIMMEMTTEEVTESNKQFKKLRLITIRYSLFIILLLDLKYKF